MTLADVQAHLESAITLTYTSEGPIGGVAEGPETAPHRTGAPADGAERSAGDYALAAGGIVLLTVACGSGLYLRRRRLRT
jgi:hypothetical protein